MKNKGLWILAGILLLINCFVDNQQEAELEKIEECLIDIDQRITRLEQTQHDNDTIMVKALQGVNECMWEIKMMKK